MPIKNKKVRVFAEIAEDETSRQNGFMFRKHLGQDQGMLFCFSSDDYLSFWMKDTYIPLDIAFIDSFWEVIDIKQGIPLSTKGMRSSKPCRYALEMNKGWFGDKGIKAGYSFENNIKTSKGRAGDFDIVITEDFKTAVWNALHNGWNLVVSYRFRPVEYRKGKAIPRDGGKPSLNDYQLILDGSVKLSDGKYFDFKDSGNGQYIVVPCLNTSGDPRCFFVDGIVEFRYFTKGRSFIDPRELDLNVRKKRRMKFKENPALKGVESIPF